MTLSSQLDRCVMCGMCSPHCPTYGLSLDENESPRGRIALVSAYLKHRLPIDEKLTGHLDHCLECRACEHYCPSGVPFGAIMDEARTQLETRRRRPWYSRMLRRWALHSVTDGKRLRRVFSWLRRGQKAGIQSLLRATGSARWENLLPPLPAPRSWAEYYPPKSPIRGNVALFTGCISNTLGQAALESTIHVLNTLGYGVHVPASQVCCGALHRHNGDPEGAAQLVRQNVTAFADLDADAILHTATGCTATLSEYADHPHLPAALREPAQRFAAKVADINQFLLTIEWPDDAHFRPLRRRVAIHTPCSQVHVLRQEGTSRELLQRIPNLELVMLDDNENCCGGAGSYFLTQPAWAARLRQPKIEQLVSLNVDMLVTANIGCALYLRAGLLDRGKNLEIRHPVELLARQLGNGAQ